MHNQINSFHYTEMRRQSKPVDGYVKEEDPVVTDLITKKYKDSTECGKAIVRHVWTDDELRNRVVRRTAGIDKEPLSPEKVDKAKEYFGRWLKSKGYLKDAAQMELQRFNGIMGRVIENITRNNPKTGNDERKHRKGKNTTTKHDSKEKPDSPSIARNLVTELYNVSKPPLSKDTSESS